MCPVLSQIVVPHPTLGRIPPWNQLPEHKGTKSCECGPWKEKLVLSSQDHCGAAQSIVEREWRPIRQAVRAYLRPWSCEEGRTNRNSSFTDGKAKAREGSRGTAKMSWWGMPSRVAGELGSI